MINQELGNKRKRGISFMKLLGKLKKPNKGFTLVEVIVVLVIIAILAALLIPALTGYIKKANNSAAIAEARTVLVAMQTEASEGTWTTGHSITDAEYADIESLAELTVKGKVSSVTFDAKGKVASFTYTSTDNISVSYNATATEPFTTGGKAESETTH